jgi:hypothetical protein
LVGFLVELFDETWQLIGSTVINGENEAVLLTFKGQVDHRCRVEHLNVGVVIFIRESSRGGYSIVLFPGEGGIHLCTSFGVFG